MKKRCFNCILLLILFYQSPAQVNLLFKTYSFAQGLNSYNIFKTSQDAYGFIWIATQDGLFRFNGKGFEVIKNNTGNTNSTMGNAFADVVIGADNQVYTADYYHGIDIIDAATWQVNYIGDDYPAHKLPNYWIEKICVDKKLNLWLGGKGYLAFKRKADKIFTVLNKLPNQAEAINVSFIKEVSDSCVAVGVINYGVLFFNTKTLQQTDFITLHNNSFAGMAVNDIYRNGDTAFAITNTAIIKGVMSNKKWQTVTKYTPTTLQNLLTTSVAYDKNNGLWIGTNAGIVYFNTATQQTEIFKADKRKTNWLKDNYINHLMIDDQDNLWISTFNVLQMVSLKGHPFKSYSGDKEGSDFMEHIYSLVAKNKTEIFCTGTDGLYITIIETGVTKRIPGSNTLGLIHHIEKIEDDCWIISADKGMYAYEPVSKQISQQRLLQKYPEWNVCRNNYFNNAYRRGDTWYWASEEREGLVKWDKQKHTITQFKAGTLISGGLTEGHIRNIKTDREGFLWVLSDATLSKFNMAKDTVVEILYFKNNKNAPHASLYFDMFDDGKTLWFASYGAGLCGYDKKSKTWQFINEQNGLCNNSVYSILPENDSVFWVSTNMGLSRVNHFTKLCSNFFYEDGLQDNSFDEKGSLIFDDKLLFGGINGFTAVDIKKKKNNNNNFPVFIHYVEYFVDNKKYSIRKLKWDKLDLPTGTNSVEIFLTALTFTENHKIKFSYKIEGIHKSYIDAGNANSIILNALGYGTYHISIGYRTPNGIYVNDALQITVYIKPKWYQTWWFYLLIALSAAAMLYALYKYRIRQIERQHEIRKNIATDLHDDLGSTLNSVKIFTNLAIGGIKQAESLQQVKDNLTEATMSLRDMIWVLDDSLDTVDELITRLKQFAIPVAAASNMEATIKASSDVNNRQLTKEEKRNLFLICKEAINNSIKYSGATKINVDITASAKKIQIAVADNGKGFNADEVIKGYGLKNMQYRAGQIKYKVALTSAPGSGTQITILPA